MNKLLFLFVVSILSQGAMAEVDVLYGEDNRRDVYQTPNMMHRMLARSTAAMIHASLFVKNQQGAYSLRGVPSLQQAINLCSQEAFASQPAAASCSGFLVGPDTLVTAGHCYIMNSTAEQSCKSFAWVFDFDMKSPSHDPTRFIPENNIYLCKQVIKAELNNRMDFAIIKLDRPVVGRAPLKFRQAGRIHEATPLVVIGHPTGIPTKISIGGRVTRNADMTQFSTTLDTFHGNSGSAVFNATNGLIEGILIQGKNDYIPSNPRNKNSCVVVNRCENNGINCLGGIEEGAVKWGEVVLRIETIAPLLRNVLTQAR